MRLGLGRSCIAGMCAQTLEPLIFESNTKEAVPAAPSQSNGAGKLTSKWALSCCVSIRITERGCT